MSRTLDAIFEDGVLKPLGDPGLQEHALVEIEIEIREKPQPREARPHQRTFGSAKGLIRSADDFAEPLEDAEEVKAWSREIAAAADKIPEEEHERFLAAVREVKKEAKDQVRRVWGLT